MIDYHTEVVDTLYSIDEVSSLVEGDRISNVVILFNGTHYIMLFTVTHTNDEQWLSALRVQNEAKYKKYRNAGYLVEYCRSIGIQQLSTRRVIQFPQVKKPN